MPSSPPSFELSFPNGLSARAFCVQDPSGLPKALEQLGLKPSSPVLVLIGGASHLSSSDYHRLISLFTNLLAPLAEELGMTVIDGGRHTATARVREAAELSVIDERKFRFMVDEVPNFAYYIMKAMASRIRGMRKAV